MVLGRRGGTPTTTRPAPARAAPPVRVRRGDGFIRDVVSELRKVTWPTRQEATRLTAIVVIVSVALGVFLGGVDYVFYWLINSLLLGKPV